MSSYNNNNNSPSANALTLSALGYDLASCVRALAATNDDLFEAAEYLLSYSSDLAAESQLDSQLQSSVQAMETAAEEVCS